jgi:hypothetical protein
VLGVTAVADALDAAISEGAIALGFALEDWDGEHPVPRTLDALRKDSQFIDWSANAVVAAIPAPSAVTAAA